MAPQPQIEANRRNALKSTGPRTPEGKAAVSRHALKHGSRRSWRNCLCGSSSSHLLIPELQPVSGDMGSTFGTMIAEPAGPTACSTVPGSGSAVGRVGRSPWTAPNPLVRLWRTGESAAGEGAFQQRGIASASPMLHPERPPVTVLCQSFDLLAGPSPSGNVSFERKKNTALRCWPPAPRSGHWPV